MSTTPPALPNTTQQHNQTNDSLTNKQIAVVFGGTGACGQHILNQLLNAPEIDEVHSFVRKPSLKHMDNPKHKEIILSSNITDDLTQHFPARANVVFSSVATTRKQAGSADAFRAVDYTLNLDIASFARKNNVPQFYFISSVGADANSSNFYLRTKGEFDNALAALEFPRSVIFRPGILSRAGQRPDEPTRWNEIFMHWFIEPFWCCTSGFLGKFAPITTENVGKAMVGDYINNRYFDPKLGPQLIFVEGSAEILKKAQQYEEYLSDAKYVKANL